jgi:hypothetical protein
MAKQLCAGSRFYSPRGLNQAYCLSLKKEDLIKAVQILKEAITAYNAK